MPESIAQIIESARKDDEYSPKHAMSGYVVCEVCGLNEYGLSHELITYHGKRCNGTIQPD